MFCSYSQGKAGCQQIPDMQYQKDPYSWEALQLLFSIIFSAGRLRVGASLCATVIIFQGSGDKYGQSDSSRILFRGIEVKAVRVWFKTQPQSNQIAVG